MAKVTATRRWLVGISRGKNSSPLPDTYLFMPKAEASTWAKNYPMQHPMVVEPGLFICPKES